MSLRASPQFFFFLLSMTLLASACSSEDPVIEAFVNTALSSKSSNSTGSTLSTGSGSSDPTFDLDANGVPEFVSSDYIELSRIAKVTLFRGTAWGHDYSDATETCRTMKHYYIPSGAGSTWTTIKIYAPVSGTVTELGVEQSGGTQTHIQADEQPAFTFILFHTSVGGLQVGDHVTAGQQLGTHAMSTTTSDIAVRVNTPGGMRLVSYFLTMTDSLMAHYLSRGAAVRADFIQTQAARDADSIANSITCDADGYYSNMGSLAGWFILN